MTLADRHHVGACSHMQIWGRSTCLLQICRWHLDLAGVTAWQMMTLCLMEAALMAVMAAIASCCVLRLCIPS